MRKFIRSIFKFIFFIIIFYIGFIIIWGDFSPLKKNLNYKIGAGGHTFTRLNDLKSVKDIDVLFLGSSHTYRGFDTRIFERAGFKAFNMGTNSQTPIQTEFLLDEYLDSLNPKVVIFEVCPFVFSLDGVESTLEFISNRKIDIETVKLALKQNHLKIYNTLIYSMYRELVHHDKANFSEGRKRHNDEYIDGGFVEIKLIYYKHESFDTKKWVYRNELFESFQRIIKELNKRDIAVIFVQAPVTSDLYNSYENNKDFDNEMIKYGTYYNFNEILNLNDTLHFFDFHHLNKNGIEIFNKEIVNVINQTEIISFQGKK